MKHVLRAVQAVALVAAGMVAVLALTEGTAIRFCCTPQQSQACAAQGGTASCRTGVCQCLF